MGFRRSPDACFGTVVVDGDDRLVLWSPTERRLHVLNSTAATVWELIDRPRSYGELIEELVLRYSAPKARVEQDVRPLLERLNSSGLVVDSQTASPATPSEAISVGGLVDAERSTVLAPHSIGPLQVLGARMIVDVEDPQLHRALARILDPLRADSSAPLNEPEIHIGAVAESEGWSVVRDGQVMTRPVGREAALRCVLAEVNVAPLSKSQGTVVLHASGAEFAGVGGEEEAKNLVVFPGVSNAGKSTLVAQLCSRGHAYLSDEAVAIGVASLHAQPFHKSICIEPAAQLVIPELAPTDPIQISSTWDVDPRTVGPGRLSSGGAITSFVFPSYVVGAETSLEPLEPLDLLQKLIANAFEFSGVGQPAFSALVRLANATAAYTLEHGGDGTQLDALERIFGRSPQVGLAA